MLDIDVKELIEEEKAKPLRFVQQEAEYVKVPLYDENEIHERREALLTYKEGLLEVINNNCVTMGYTLADKYNSLFAMVDELIVTEAELYGMSR